MLGRVLWASKLREGVGGGIGRVKGEGEVCRRDGGIGRQVRSMVGISRTEGVHKETERQARSLGGIRGLGRQVGSTEGDQVEGGIHGGEESGKEWGKQG